VLRIAIVGATGAVGRSVLTLLDRGLGPPVEHVVPVASRTSAGVELGPQLGLAGAIDPVVPLDRVDFAAVDAAVFCAGADISRSCGEPAAAAGALVVDNSSAFRMHPAVPLVVPQVNPSAVDGRPALNVIANPNCSSIQLVRALHPLHRLAGLDRVVVSTYQAASGGGMTGLAEVTADAAAMLAGPRDWLGAPRPVPAAAGRFGAPLAFNLVPHIGPVDRDGVAHEERKLAREPRKILGLPELRVSATAVRVPVLHCHSEAVHVRLRRPVRAAEVEDALAAAPELRVYRRGDEPAYPMPREIDGDQRGLVHVGRVRVDPEDPYAVWLWVVADNLWVGAALNAVQILRLVADRGWWR
jgi:aspartate-semialdehyde dehydrogenase